MRHIEYDYLIDKTIKNSLANKDRYIKYLKVMAYNHNYDMRTQFSILEHKPYATACTTYKFWRDNIGNTVVRYQKGIPYYDYKAKKMDYIFDVSQTVYKTREKLQEQRKDIPLFNFDRDKEKEIFNNIIERYDIDSSKYNSLEERLNKIIQNAINFNNLYTSFDKNVYKDFLEESIKIATYHRLGLDYKANEDIINRSLSKMNLETFKSINIYLNAINYNLIENLHEEQTKINKIQYNKDINYLEGEKDEVLRRPNRRRDTQREGASYKHTNGGRLIRERDRDNRRYTGENEGYNSGAAITDEPGDVLRNSESEVSIRFGNRSESYVSGGIVYRPDFDRTRNENTEELRGIRGNDNSGNDEIVGNNRGTQENELRRVERTYEQSKEHNRENGTGGVRVHRGDGHLWTSRDVRGGDGRGRGREGDEGTDAIVKSRYTTSNTMGDGTGRGREGREAIDLSRYNTSTDSGDAEREGDRRGRGGLNLDTTILNETEMVVDNSTTIFDVKKIETEAEHLKEDYWIIEFNETIENQVKSYKGEYLTRKLLDEIKELDEKINWHNTVNILDDGSITDGYLGYYKFYFDHIQDGKVIESLRGDIGDGNELNQELFKYLYEQINPIRENKEYNVEEVDNAINDITEKVEDSELLNNNLNEINNKENVITNKFIVDTEEIQTEKLSPRERLSKEIDLVLDNKLSIYESVKIMENTPNILRNIGMKDYPILMSQNHIRNCLQKKGKNSHWHGLSKDNILNIPMHLENPTIIMNSFTDENSKIIITDTVDKDNSPIIISLKSDGKGNYKAETLDSNYITSIYGKNNFENFLKRNIEANNIIFTQKNKIQNLELFSKLQLFRAFPKDFEFNSIINQNINNINIFEKTPAKNFVITNEVQAEKLTPSTRLNNNLEAISMLKRLEKGERELDSTAQEVLARYVGWGGLADVFDEDKKGQWEVARNFLKINLGISEYEKAKESTLTAFYTPKFVIDGMYQALDKMGFSKGNILEPSMGIGNFIGNMPENMKYSRVYGVELDNISGNIAKYLYPEANIKVMGLEETNFSNNFFDVAIGNVPFGNFKVHDMNYYKNNFLIHDYFFAKSIDKVRSGGIIAFITSSGTLDKKDDSVRRYIGSRCEFLGAIRLPNTTFKGVAGTEVTSDIIFLKKKNNIKDIEQDWYKLETDKNGLKYNKYFVDNPDMVLGEMKATSGRFGETIDCIIKEDVDIKGLLQTAIEKLDGKIDEVELEKDVKYIDIIPAEDDSVRNYSYTIINNDIYYRENSLFVLKDMSSKERKIIKDYLVLKDALKDVIDAQKRDLPEEKIIETRAKLNKVYDEFSIKNGFINSRTNTRILSNDSNFPLVSSIEKIEKNKFKEKSDIFFKRTIAKPKIIDKVNNSKEALIVSVANKGNVDFEYMSILLSGKDKREIIEELKGEIFLDIKKFDKENNLKPFTTHKNNENFAFKYVTADEYLSGNIRDKIKILDKYIKEYKDNILVNELKDELKQVEFQKEKLQEVMPKEIEASEINVELGATWVPDKYIKDFVCDTFSPTWIEKSRIDVKYSKFNSEWKVEGKNGNYNNNYVNLTYGTARVNAYNLLEDCLNLKDTKVYDKYINEDYTEERVLNKKETLLVNQKQELLKEEFRNWIFKEPQRRKELQEIYNEKFNSTVNRQFNGSSLVLSGINLDIILKQHQKDAIARTLYGGNTLLAHVVGAGKTYEMVASAMESKRLGMCSKSLFVVPNHLTEQIGREFMQLYPSANIMVATKKDFIPANRKRFIGKIATGEYDAVIIGHSQFEKIPMSKEYQENYIQKQIDEIQAFRLEVICSSSSSKNFTIKQLAKTRKSLEAKLKKLNNDFKKDKFITFEELGVDKLFVDEAHAYKNLFFPTKMKNVAGIGQIESQKSSDMFMKCRYLDEITNGKGIVFATGTPVSNSMTELYTMQRYLQYNELEKRDFQNFDAWASTFGKTVNSIELAPEGNRYTSKTRFAKFHNLPELMTMFKEIADIKTADSLDLDVPEAIFKNILTQPSEEQKEILKSLADRASMVRDRKVEPKEDNMLKITNDGKKLALDQRLINPLLPDDENSKVNTCVKNIFNIWNETKGKKSTQLVFCDMSTPKGDGKFNIYDDMKNKLINMGISKNDIAFIHDANNEKQKDELFEKVKKGEVRILFGSTQKMGAGTNVQEKLIAIHDLDVPWRPSDLEQRSGRIIRQGNENKKVHIFRYVTENTFDSYLWQTIENKQKFISQIMTSKTPLRVMEDVDECILSYAEIKALATGNPLIKEKMDLDVEVAKLKMLESNHKSNIYQLQDKINKTYPNEIYNLRQIASKLEEDIKNTIEKKTDNNKFIGMEINGIFYADRKEAGERLIESAKSIKDYGKVDIAKYRNFKIQASYNTILARYNLHLINQTKHTIELSSNVDGNIIKMDNLIAKLPIFLEDTNKKISEIENQLKMAKIEVEKSFDKADLLKEKILRLSEINMKIDMDMTEDNREEVDTTLSNAEVDNNIPCGDKDIDKKKFIQDIIKEKQEKLKENLSKNGIDNKIKKDTMERF